MKATFYNNKSEDNRVDKELLYVANFDIVLKTPSSIKNPITPTANSNNANLF